MVGIDRNTFQPINNLSSTLQSVEVILTTGIGERVMRREFGGGVVHLLGRALTPKLFNAFRQLVGLSIDEHEPRLTIRKIGIDGTVDNLRVGRASLRIEADFRPRAHLGDPTVERAVNFSLSFAGGKATAL
ncbi:GPW/gp25 family protein [Roseibium algae]|uniref:GPW/gp25 family protein n=1 Tax=Roseibium algae TaxID=3123038 RepID=A0ABU8TJW2_9HYPH